MADWYVWSGATGGGTGADWTNAYVNLSSISAKAAGDRFFVAHDHAQTQASALTVTSPGTEAAPCRIYCANRAGSVPPVAADLRTTATVTTTGASAISLAGSVAECYGIIFSAGDAANTANININSTISRIWRLKNCALRLGNTSASSRIAWCTGAGANVTIADNTTVQFGIATQIMNASGRCIWRNTLAAVTGAIIPNNLFGYSGGGSWFLEGVDLTAMAGKSLFAQSGNNSAPQGVLKDCKLGAGTLLSVPQLNAYGYVEATMIRCDSGDVQYRSEKLTYSGAQTMETSIVLTGGASDGSQPVSWKIITTANSKLELPFECMPITVWNDTIGSAKTLTVQGIWGTGTVPNNDDIWIEVEYLGTDATSLGSRVSSGKAGSLFANAPCAAGSGTWGGSTTKFAMSVTFTPMEKGFVTVYVYAAKLSSTFYVDPKPVIT